MKKKYIKENDAIMVSGDFADVISYGSETITKTFSYGTLFDKDFLKNFSLFGDDKKNKKKKKKNKKKKEIMENSMLGTIEGDKTELQKQEIKDEKKENMINQAKDKTDEIIKNILDISKEYENIQPIENIYLEVHLSFEEILSILLNLENNLIYIKLFLDHEEYIDIINKVDGYLFFLANYKKYLMNNFSLDYELTNEEVEDFLISLSDIIILINDLFTLFDLQKELEDTLIKTYILSNMDKF